MQGADRLDIQLQMRLHQLRPCQRQPLIERYVGWAADGGRAPSAVESERAYSSVDQLQLFEPEGLRYPSPVCRIRPVAVGHVPLLDVQPGVAHRPRRVLE